MKKCSVLVLALFIAAISFGETRPLPRRAQVWDPKINSSAPAETRRVRIVDFGQAPCRWNNKVGYGYTLEKPNGAYQDLYVDTDGNPETDDWVETLPFSLKHPMSPQVPQYDTTWDSSVFAGGIGFIYANRRDKNGLSEKYTNTAEGFPPMKPGCNWAIHAQNRVEGSPLRGYFVPIWRKQEFPHLGDRYPVSFDPTSKIGLYTQRYWSGYEGIRFAVVDSGKVYLSETLPNNWRESSGGTKRWDLRIVHPTEVLWTPWSVKEGDWDLKLADAQFSKQEFNNVEGIGFYIFKDAFNDTEVAAKWECFEAYANVTHPKIPSETIAMNEVGAGVYMATCETPYEVWKRIFRMSRSIGQFVFDEEPGMLYDRFGNMGSQRYGEETHSQAEPVTDLTLRDVLAWCNALSEYEGREFVYYTTPDFQPGTEFRYVIRGAWHKDPSVYEKTPIYVKWNADGFRLPTPAEWTMAGGQKTDVSGQKSEKTSPVGSGAPNAAGLYDMDGNVRELVWIYGDEMPAEPQEIVTLGGDFLGTDNPEAHSASPYGDQPFDGSYNIGFRLLRREKGMAKPDTSFNKAALNTPTWVITPETKTAVKAPKSIEVKLADIPEGKLFGYDMTAFKMGATEITYRQWKPVYDWAKAHGYTFDSDGDMGSMDHRLYTIDTYTPDEPVTDISYFDLLAWCNALSEMNGLTPVFYADEARTQVYRNVYRYRQSQLMNRNYDPPHTPLNSAETDLYIWPDVPGRKAWVKWDADGYRLPTTFEWLYAYNAGATTTYPWGENFEDAEEEGWVYSNADGRTHPVGKKKPNAFGLYDMVGNAVESCLDHAGKRYELPRGQKVNPLFDRDPSTFTAETQVTFLKVGLIHFAENSFQTHTGKEPDQTRIAGTIPGWYWADSGFRIVKRNAGDYTPGGLADLEPPPPFTPLPDLEKRAGFDELQGSVYRGNLRRDGVFQTTGLPKAKGIKWSFKTGGPVKSSPVYVNGIVYVGSEDRSVYAVNAESGKQIWSFETEAPVLSSAVVAGGMVYITSGTQIYALDALSGELKWKNKFGNRNRNAYGSPAVAYGVVFCPAGARKGDHKETSWGGFTMVGFDAVSGKPVWRQSEGRGPQGLSSPVVSDGKLVWCDGYVANRVDLKSGKLDWTSPRGKWNSAQVSTPAISGDFVFHIGTYGADHHGLPLNGELMVIDPNTGKTYWSIHPYDGTDESQPGIPADGKNHAIRGSVAVAGDLAFTADSAGEVYALDYQKKERVWKFEADEGVESSPSYANGLLYFGCNDGHLYALNAKTGKLAWKIHCAEGEIVSSPWIADGVIYIGAEDGTVSAIQ